MEAGSETTAGWPGVVLVWGIAIVGAIVVVALAYSGASEWLGDAGRLGVFGALGIVLAASVIAALIVQLATRRPEGFVMRVSWSVTGAAAIVAIAALVVAPLAAS